jgi:hypothetical protein
MATAKTHHQALAELRALGTARQRGPSRMSEVAPLFARLLSSCKTLGVEDRAGGIAFRLEGAAGKSGFSITCLLHHSRASNDLTTAEQAVAEQSPAAPRRRPPSHKNSLEESNSFGSAGNPGAFFSPTAKTPCWWFVSTVNNGPEKGITHELATQNTA